MCILVNTFNICFQSMYQALSAAAGFLYELSAISRDQLQATWSFNGDHLIFDKYERALNISI